MGRQPRGPLQQRNTKETEVCASTESLTFPGILLQRPVLQLQHCPAESA